MKFNGDVDIDVGNRDLVLSKIKHVPAAMRKVDPKRKHLSGVHITPIPYDPVLDMAAIDYKEAEHRGYFKLDLLNVHVYAEIKDEMHLIELMQEPDWNKLNDRKFVSNLIHLSNHFDSIKKMPEPINSIPRLAMFLAVIRPSKRHLIGKTWDAIAKSVWEKDDTGYSFKKSHSIGYAWLVAVHMNLLCEKENGN